jgi:N-hydroxyarylamine O-acetyltransferase
MNTAAMRTVDLPAYFTRIGYAGPHAPTLETLRAIHTSHAQTIPFENLNPLAGWPVLLDPSALEQKLLRDGRGGYCFEQNLLLSYVLETIGFRVTRLAARVLWNMPLDTIMPRSHMLLRIEIDGTPYIADVGFGGLTLTTPLRLTAGTPQSTTHEPFRLVEEPGGFIVQAEIAGVWKPLYRFDLQEQQVADYEVSSWYLSNHPKSRFVNNLLAALPEPGRRYALLNNIFTTHHLAGKTERRALKNAGELRDALIDTFHTRVPQTPDMDAALERVITRSQAAGS